MLSNIRDLTAQEGERLVRFVAEGGGIGVFPGEQTDEASINSTLLKGLEIPGMSGGTSTGQGNRGDENQGSFAFSTIDFAHPLFAGLFEDEVGGRKGGREIESPDIRAHIRVQAGSHGNVVIGLNDGSPFLVEFTAGAGRVLLYAVAPSLTWSDFPLKGIFAPLIHRSSVYLATGEDGQSESIVGFPARVSLRRQGDARSTYFLKTPDDIRERVDVALNPVTGMMIFTSPPTRTAGLYELYEDTPGSTLLGVAAVNIDPAESMLRPADEEEIRAFAASLGLAESGITIVADPAEIQRIVTESRYGLELWKFMLAVAIVLALSEMAVARVGAREGATASGGA
jgi:hypothetical protein